MSWLFSRALVEEYLEGTCSDGAPFAPSSANPTPRAYLSPDKMTAFSRPSRFGMTFAPLTDGLGEELLTWYRVGFPARTLATPGNAPASTEKEAGCGLKWRESFAKFDPDTHSLKMSQHSLFVDLEQSLAIWPRWGSMHDGECFHRVPQVAHTHVKDCSFWLTPTVSDAADRVMSVNSRGEPKLSGQFKLRTGEKMPPSFAEWIMRWPVGWTDLNVLATGRMQEWLQAHGEF